ncbi:hypothetical protein ACRCP3_26875 [Pseudomonas aeruginosa]|uniref:hypothetical protein n=1 Tax=Pseudomonas aeruginosa TaxID=287 RepID=UPI00227BC1C9|nr:hypothetical protein [Pseudomonas aeruginosa]WAJ88606.1 hypothetical protein PAC13_34965 [Pseudomonas aeruginosa]
MTGHSDEDVSPEALRKREQRDRDEALGIKEIEVRMGAGEVAMLEEGRRARAGSDKPYSRTEYINTLIRRDNELLRQQLGKLEGRICEACRKPLPRGCGGVWGWDAGCVRTAADRALEL